MHFKFGTPARHTITKQTGTVGTILSWKDNQVEVVEFKVEGEESKAVKASSLEPITN